MSSETKSGTKRKSPGFHLFFDEMAELLTDKGEVFQIVSEMWDQLNKYAQKWYTKKAMKNISIKQIGSNSSDEIAENLSPGFQLFLSEMKSLVVGPDVVEEVEKIWKEFDDLARYWYQVKAEKIPHEKLKTKKVIENKKILNKSSGISKTKLNGQQPKNKVSELLPKGHKKDRTNDVEKKALLQRPLVRKKEEYSEKKTSKTVCSSLKSNEYIKKVCLDETINFSNNTSEKVINPPSKSKRCERKNCNRTALVGQPWGEGFCSERCVIEDFKKEFETLLEDYNRPPNQRKYLKL